MLCQNCGKNDATTYIKRIVNGSRTELHLCSECAEKLGYGDLFSGFGFNMGNMFANFLSDFPLSIGTSKVSRCETCGSSFDDIVRSGMLGCADCYNTFRERLLPSLQRIHGKVKHVGKQGAAMGSEAVKENKVEKLKAELKKAVDEQNYEQAAVLRDQIKEEESGAQE